MKTYFKFSCVSCRCDRVYSAVDDKGTAVDDIGSGVVRPWEITHALVTLRDARSKKLTDRLWSYGGQLLLSEFAHRVIVQFQADEGMLVIPTSVVTKKGEKRAEYLLYWPRKEHEILDREKAEYKLMANTQYIQEVVKWVVDARRIPPGDIFYAGHSTWFVTEPFAKAFQEHEITGCCFTPVELSHVIEPASDGRRPVR